MSLLKMKPLFIVILFSVFIFSCEIKEDINPVVMSEVQHPKLQEILSEEEIRFTISMKQQKIENHLERLTSHLENMQLVTEIGLREGNQHEMIGEIAQIALKDKLIYILDSRYGEIKVYNTEGDYVQSYGSLGDGPEEFSHPIGIALYGQKHFVVGDRGRQLKIFTRNDGQLSYQSSIKLEYEPDSFCTMKERIYVSGSILNIEESTHSGVVHIYSLDGNYETSLGQSYPYGNPLVRLKMSQGRVACASELESIVTMPMYTPLISSYSLNGDLLWRSNLSEFHPTPLIEFTDEGRPGIRFDNERPYSDHLFQLTSAPDNSILLQYYRVVPKGESARPDVGLHTYLIDAESGKGMYLGKDLPLIHVITSNLVIGSIDTPFPQVQVFHIDLSF